jgi:hypothetical protein
MDTKADSKTVDALQAVTITMADMKDELAEWRPMIDRLRAQLAQDGRAQEERHTGAVMTLEDRIDRLQASVVFWRRIALLFVGLATSFVGLHFGWR